MIKIPGSQVENHFDRARALRTPAIDTSLPESTPRAGSHTSDGQFIYTTGQVGADLALKAELAATHPELRFAYSKPGFWTWKVAQGIRLAEGFELQSTFARAFGFSIGAVTGDTTAARFEQVVKAAAARPYRQLHIWPRDICRAGQRGFEPGMTPAAIEVIDAARNIPALAPLVQAAYPLGKPPRSVTPPPLDGLVLDLILLSPDEWWLGEHRTSPLHLPWPGGLSRAELPPHAVSRAYLKLEQGLLWSRLPLKPSNLCCELGSSPGGAAQCLLDQGLRVIGVDPAEMAPEVMANPNFTHIRRRTPQVRRKMFRKVKWLFADMNVAPSYTLDAAEAIVTHPETQIKGMLLTLKLPQWELAAELPAYLNRIRDWGYANVRARQLQHHRQELIVAAT